MKKISFSENIMSKLLYIVLYIVPSMNIPDHVTNIEHTASQ